MFRLRGVLILGLGLGLMVGMRPRLLGGRASRRADWVF